MTFEGRINQYTCTLCECVITTVDHADGTTPMMLACQVTPDCRGRMMSSMYNVDQTLTPDYEWYKPTGKVEKHMRDYVKAGGLLLREIEAQP